MLKRWGKQAVPAIDLLGGRVVRLHQGRYDEATVYADDPSGQAARFARDGATALHVVDLDGAFAGSGVNSRAVEAIVVAFPSAVLAASIFHFGEASVAQAKAALAAAGIVVRT